MPTLGCEGGAGGEGVGEVCPTELWAGLVPLWMLLFWSSGLSGAGDGLSWLVGDTLLVVSAVTVVSLDVSVATKAGDKRWESEFKS